MLPGNMRPRFFLTVAERSDSAELLIPRLNFQTSDSVPSSLEEYKNCYKSDAGK